MARRYEREYDREGWRRGNEGRERAGRYGRQEDRGFFDRAGDETHMDEMRYGRGREWTGRRDEWTGRGGDWRMNRGRDYGQDYGRDYGRDYGQDYGRRLGADEGWAGPRSSEEDYRPTFGGENFGGEGGPVDWMPDRGWQGQSERWQGQGRYGQGRRGQGEWGRGEQGRFTGHGSRNYKRTDDRIIEDVNEELWRHPMIDASDIDVTCTNGEITLTGTVESREMKRMAEDIAESVWGVKEVHNQIRMKEKDWKGKEAA